MGAFFESDVAVTELKIFLNLHYYCYYSYYLLLLLILMLLLLLLSLLS